MAANTVDCSAFVFLIPDYFDSVVVLNAFGLGTAGGIDDLAVVDVEVSYVAQIVVIALVFEEIEYVVAWLVIAYFDKILISIAVQFQLVVGMKKYALGFQRIMNRNL